MHSSTVVGSKNFLLCGVMDQSQPESQESGDCQVGKLTQNKHMLEPSELSEAAEMRVAMSWVSWTHNAKQLKGAEVPVS
jgi:hypothetical protein